MDTVTLPRSFEDTTPAEMMKNYPRRRPSRSSQSQRSPILEPVGQPQNYSSITPVNFNLERNQNTVEEPHSDEHEESDEEVHREWWGKRIWRTFQKWERDHFELVLENKQSVARDHLGECVVSWMTDYSE